MNVRYNFLEYFIYQFFSIFLKYKDTIFGKNTLNDIEVKNPLIKSTVEKIVEKDISNQQIHKQTNQHINKKQPSKPKPNAHIYRMNVLVETISRSPAV